MPDYCWNCHVQEHYLVFYPYHTKANEKFHFDGSHFIEADIGGTMWIKEAITNPSDVKLWFTPLAEETDYVTTFRIVVRGCPEWQQLAAEPD
jgi:hypothetical protein